MQTDNFNAAQVALENFINNTNTAWGNFSGDIPNMDANKSNYDIVQDCTTMETLKNSVLYTTTSPQSLANLVTAMNEILGNGIDSSNGYIEQLLTSAVNLEKAKAISVTQGTQGADIVAQMLESSNNTFKVYTQLATAIQQLYNLESANAMLAYAQKADLICSDTSKIPNIQAFDGINLSNDLSENMTILNQLYTNRFKSLDSIIAKNANLYSDHIAQITDSNSSVTGIYSTSEYAGVPQGNWNSDANLSKAGTLFTPFILVSKEYNATGYYDGKTLKSVNSFDRNSTTSLDLSTCLKPTTDMPSMIAWGATAENNNTSSQKLSCGWIRAESYFDSTDTYWTTKNPSGMPSHDKAPWQWSAGISHEDKGKLTFDSNFNIFIDADGKQVHNADTHSGQAISKDNKIMASPDEVHLQTVQFTSPEGEKAVFQFSITDQIGYEKRMAITCGDKKDAGVYKNADNNQFECVDVQYADQVAEKIHMKFPLTGKEYTLYLGARGKSKEIKDAPNEEYFLDYCKYNTTCSGLESYNVKFELY